MSKYYKLIFSILISLYFLYIAKNYTEWHFLDGVDLIFHEAGHTIFFFANEITVALMGSVFQVLVPIIFVLYFLRSYQPISASIILMWVGQSILNVSVYIKDAKDMALPLLGGDGVKHDWNFILTKLNIINYTYNIFSLVHIFGIILIIVGASLACYLSYIKSKENIIA